MKKQYSKEICKNAAVCNLFSMDNPICYQHDGCPNYRGSETMKIEDEVQALGFSIFRDKLFKK